MRRVRWPAFVAFAGGLVLVVVAWNSVKPSNDRDWQTEVAVLPYATINGDLVTVHNIRNFDYRTETDFTPANFELRAWRATSGGGPRSRPSWRGRSLRRCVTPG